MIQLKQTRRVVALTFVILAVACLLPEGLQGQTADEDTPGSRAECKDRCHKSYIEQCKEAQEDFKKQGYIKSEEALRFRLANLEQWFNKCVERCN